MKRDMKLMKKSKGSKCEVKEFMKDIKIQTL